MDGVRDAIASKWGRVVAIALLLAGVVTAVPAFSATASAHHSNISASVSCDGTVSWTASSWSTGDQGSHGDIRVWADGDDGSTKEIQHGTFSAENGYEFSGTFAWPDSVSSMTVHSKPSGAWGNGVVSEDGGDVTITKPADCEDHPEVGKSVECEESSPGYGDGSVTFTFTNSAGPFGHDAEFAISGPDGSQGGTYHVPSGQHEQVTYHGLDDGHHSVHVKSGDHEYDEEFEIDCDESMPSIDVAESCVAGDGAITVNLSNTGGDPVDFEVEHPVTGEVEHITLEANQSASRTFTGLDDGHYVVPVHAGELDMSQEFEVDCDHDAEPPHEECPDDGGHHEGTSTSTESSTESSYGASGARSTSTTDGDDDGHGGDHDCDDQEKPDEECPDDGGDGGHHEGTSTSTESSTESSSESGYGASGSRYTSTSQHPSTSEHPSTSGHPTTSDDDGHDCNPPDEPGDGVVKVAKACVDHDGQVTLTLVHVGGDVDMVFVVNGTEYVVAPDSTRQVVFGGLTDGVHHFDVLAGDDDLSFDVTVECDLAPRVKASQECVDFGGTLTLLLENLGDDADAVFTIDGVDHVVAPLSSETVELTDLPDGTTTVTLAIDGVEQPDIVVDFDCEPVIDVIAECNTIGSDGEVLVYWFTLTNTESVPVSLSWAGGQAVVPAGGSVTVATTSPVISVSHDGVEVATAQASNVVCSRSITVQKQIVGQPAAPETYTVTFFRVTGTTSTPELSVDLLAGQTKTVALPSTLDPAGVVYDVKETATGTATSSVVTPSRIVVTGHLGATINVVATNGFSQILPPPPTTTTPGATTTTTTATKPPVPTTTVPTGPLPVTGGTPLSTMLIGFGLAAMGGAMLMVRLRPA